MSADRYSLVGKRVYVAGHSGMVGGALVRRLATEGCQVLMIGRRELDLREQAAVDRWFENERPQAVIMAAGKVGGIEANNTLRADFIYDNLMMTANVLHAAHVHGVEKLMFLGSSCIYPRLAHQPMDESQLLTGPLEPTNEPYAIAKIAGIKMAESYRHQYGSDFISVMPTNLYGPGDNYHPEHSHVVAALIRRFHEAKEADAPSVAIWGSGTPRREFLFVDDLADALLTLMQSYSAEGLINIGTGQDVTIRELAELIGRTVGYTGRLEFDASRPDGAPRKLLDIHRLASLGWQSRTSLRDGLELAYAAFLNGLSNRHCKQPS